MKSFENKVTELLNNDGSKTTYAELIKTCSDFLPKNEAKDGWTATLQKESFRVEAAVKDAKPGETINIEDNDLLLIQKFCVGFGWNTKHIDLIDFDEYLQEIK